MKNHLTERNLVALLFVLVIITFSFAQRDSKRLERLYTSTLLDKKSNMAILKADASVTYPAK
jgi:hypothetical protein